MIKIGLHHYAPYTISSHYSNSVRETVNCCNM